MRVVLQRVSHASVSVARSVVGQIESGMLVFVGIGPHDTDKEITQMVDKLVGLRIFNDDQGKMNRSLLDNKGEMLVVSQFTLWGNCRKGRRPNHYTSNLQLKQQNMVFESLRELLGLT